MLFRSFEQEVNYTLCAGLEKPAGAVQAGFECPTFFIGQPLRPVSLDKVSALAAEMEDEEIVAKA